MKKGFIFLVMLLLVSTVEAKDNQPVSKSVNYVKNYHRPITFQEKGIKFYVFADGEVEFQKNRRFNSNISNSGKNRNRYYSSGPRRILVKYDRQGNLMRVGNVHLRYNYFGQVTKIGSVPVFYRQGSIKRVGGLSIKRDRYGYIRFQGNVKPRHSTYYGSSNYYYNDYVYGYNDDFFYQDDFLNDYEEFDEDDEYYYYKSKKTESKKNSKGKMENIPIVIKRKKK